MFNYVGDISTISHDIIKRYLKNYNAAVDATLGNGHDTDFLSDYFNTVYAFDIQQTAVKNYKPRRDNVILINESHEYLKDFVNDRIDCIMYNLGFLPGGDKSITTIADSTIASLTQAIAMLNPGGMISIAVYTGHKEGKQEEKAVLDFVSSLPKRNYGVMMHSFINRKDSPFLIIIEKNEET